MVDVVQTIEVAVTPEQAWAEITKLAGKQRWMLDLVLDSTLEPGAPLRYRTPDGKRIFVIGRVVEVSPPHRFVHTYLFTDKPDQPVTLVTWTLDPTPRGVRITVTHEGWPADLKQLPNIDKTWAGILRELASTLERDSISLKTRLMYRAMYAFVFMMPKTTRADSTPPIPDWMPDRNDRGV